MLGWLGPLGDREEPVKEERHGFKTLMGVCSAEMGEVQEETRHGIEAEARWPAVKTIVIVIVIFPSELSLGR